MKYTGLNRFYATTFETWKQRAADLYLELNAALAPVHGVQMTSHERTGDVVKVGYANGVVIFLNYGIEAAAMDGVAIPAKGYAVEGVNP